LVASDCVYDNVPVGPVHGPDGVAQILGPLIEGSDEIEWKVLRSAVVGSIVFNERLDRFRMGPRWVELPVAGVWEVTGEKISLWRDYFDLQSYLSQMS
jgi:limonene-1,2-epoxide hydrolase